ncbi:LARP6 [Cordylochernes scorpioides]|uniref:LARP6 n=1 Tax=Cordylochernes scorpioides TaxID=51811 RepID=A0ABY6KQ33_9ARAC|nr:LARP6 [Cordylochernes scorpioides]
MDALAARLEVNLSLNDGSSTNDSVLEENDADCSCTSSNQSSTDGESDFPSRLDKDSGVDCSVLTQDSFVSPDKELMERIIKQVEFYFSDENLKKDNFLLKHVCRTKEGNVSLKLVSSFRKVKSIAKDWRVVAYSLRHSDRLVVNEEGTKIRRREPLPEGCRPAHKVNKTVMAFNLPFDKPSMENVAELFARCGDIALIHILRPGTAVPPDIKRSMLAANYPDIGSTACAIIEFEAQESAIKAVDEMDSKDSDWRALHVLPLIFSSRNSSSKEETVEFKQRKTSRKGGKQDQHKKYFDKNRRQVYFSPGDRVWITTHPITASLRALTLCLDQLLNRDPEEAITYDGDEPAAHFFSQLESQPNFHNLEPTCQARKALSSLRGEPRKIAQELALLNKTYEEVKESICVYPRRPSFTLQEFYELKCTSMAEIETYYKNKVRIGLAINLPKSAIV